MLDFLVLNTTLSCLYSRQREVVFETKANRIHSRRVKHKSKCIHIFPPKLCTALSLLLLTDFLHHT